MLLLFYYFFEALANLISNTIECWLKFEKAVAGDVPKVFLYGVAYPVAFLPALLGLVGDHTLLYYFLGNFSRVLEEYGDPKTCTPLQHQLYKKYKRIYMFLQLYLPITTSSFSVLFIFFLIILTVNYCLIEFLILFCYKGLIDEVMFLTNLFYVDSFIQLDGVALLFILLIIVNFSFIYVYLYFKIVFARGCLLVLLCLLEFLLLVVFLSSNFFIFYMLFELILVPMLLIIGFWGSRGRKIHALYYFFYYTFLSSIFLIVNMFFITFMSSSFNFNEFFFFFFDSNLYVYVKFCFFFGFLAKIPSFPFYIWLPEAHVEAPTLGSVILASILLKLGFFGLFKTFYNLVDSENFFFFKSFFVLIFLLSFVYSSFSILCQVDLKKIVAYSSIIHMNFAMLGFLNFNYGLIGSLLLMVSHGFISSGLFFCVGFLYERYHTRNIFYFGGLVQYMPIFTITYFIILMANSSFPGTSNFVGEFLVFLSLFNYSFTLFFFLVFGLVLISLFCLILLCKVCFYQISGFLDSNLCDLEFFEFFILFVLILLIGFVGLFPNYIIGLFFFVV